MSARQFSLDIDVPEATTRNYLNRGSKPGIEYLNKVVRHFDRVSMAWLLSGEGEMFTANTLEEGGSVYNIGNSGNSVGRNVGTLTQHHGSGRPAAVAGKPGLEHENEALKKEVELLRSQLNDKERIIQLLEMQLRK